MYDNYGICRHDLTKDFGVRVLIYCMKCIEIVYSILFVHSGIGRSLVYVLYKCDS
jgi:hypothetical protein